MEALAAYWVTRPRPRRKVVLHGDPYASNVVRRRDGHLALIDFDLLTTGPPEVDLSAVLMQYKRYDGLPRVLERITNAYGAAVDEQLLAHIFAADEAISNVAGVPVGRQPRRRGGTAAQDPHVGRPGRGVELAIAPRQPREVARPPEERLNCGSP